MTDNDPSAKEERILDALYRTLINVIKDTTTDPRLRHPLSDGTRSDIRDCLDLVTARKAELAEAAGRGGAKMRPRYADEKQESVVVSLKPSGGKKGGETH
jgi:hypothetical protein